MASKIREIHKAYKECRASFTAGKNNLLIDMERKSLTPMNAKIKLVTLTDIYVRLTKLLGMMIQHYSVYSEVTKTTKYTAEENKLEDEMDEITQAVTEYGVKIKQEDDEYYTKQGKLMKEAIQRKESKKQDKATGKKSDKKDSSTLREKELERLTAETEAMRQEMEQMMNSARKSVKGILRKQKEQENSMEEKQERARLEELQREEQEQARLEELKREKQENKSRKRRLTRSFSATEGMRDNTSHTGAYATPTKRGEPIFRPANSSTPKERGYTPPGYVNPHVYKERPDEGYKVSYSDSDSSEEEEEWDEEYIEHLKKVLGPKRRATPEPKRIPKKKVDNLMGLDQEEFDTTHMLAKYKMDIFTGEKRNFSAWWTMYHRLVDRNTRIPTDIKFLILRNSLGGVAAKALLRLPQSELAYEIAKDRLQRKFGGRRRDMTIRVSDLLKFPQVKEGSATELENLAELLEGVVISLSEAGEDADMSGGVPYVIMLQKISESTQRRFHQWRREGDRPPTVHSLRSFVNLEAEGAMEAWETSHGVGAVSSTPTRPPRSYPPKRDSQSFAVGANTGQGGSFKTRENWKCRMCQGDHGLWRCELFKKLAVPERWEKAKEARVCFKCLSVTHRMDTCRADRKCNVQGCSLPHHWLLHDDSRSAGRGSFQSSGGRREVSRGGAPPQSQPTGHKPEYKSKEKESKGTPPDAEGKSSSTNVSCLQIGIDDMIALRNVIVIVSTAHKTLHVHALLDEGSARSYINEDVAMELGMQGEAAYLNVNTLNNVNTPLHCRYVEFQIASIDGKVYKQMNAYTTRKVTGTMKAVDWNQHRSKWKHLQDVNFPDADLVESREIDLLLGVDVFELHNPVIELPGDEGEPSARLTPLGWTCVGSPGPSLPTLNTHCHFTEPIHVMEDRGVRQFWELDEPPPTVYMKEEDKIALNHMTNTLSYKNGRYCVGIPWKACGPPKDKNNYHGAKQRLKYLVRKMDGDERMRTGYKDMLKEYSDKGYLQEIQLTDAVKSTGWFLPHFAIIKEDRLTTKVRVVFDAAAKDGEYCINDYMYQGPQLQQDLVDVLTRFRRYQVGVICDISQMYLRIELLETDKPYHRLLFRENASAPLKCYQMNRNTFGTRAAPGIAKYVSKHNAERHKLEFPRAAETVLCSTYMDDGMDSVITEELALKLYHEVKGLWAKAGMNASKWMTNSTSVLAAIPQEDRAGKLELTSTGLPDTKTLGVSWSPEVDCFTFRVPEFECTEEITKRQLLSHMAKLFDPLGFVSPYFIQAKMLFQTVWLQGTGWDEHLSAELNERAHKWFDGLQNLTRIKVPHVLQVREDAVEITLHTFTDASLDAYGAVVYVRHVYSDGSVTVRFGISRSRVTPLQSISVPRLELMAAVLGVKAAEVMGRVLSLEIEKCFFWSDSMDILHWIRGRSREFKPFIGNRISVIQTRSVPANWSHVRTEINPADKISRGIDCEKLIEDKLWWQGPEYLMEPEDMWPTMDIPVKHDDQEKRVKYRTVVCGHQVVKQVSKSIWHNITLHDTLLAPERWSKWIRLLRVTGYVLRYLFNIRSQKEMRIKGPLQPVELQGAENLMLRYAQQEFKEEITALRESKPLKVGSRLTSLNPWLDDDGVIRANTRLSHGQFIPFSQKYPVILPKKGDITRLIVQSYHLKCHHAGTNRVYYALSEKYWIQSCREAIREWEHICMGCKRRKCQPMTQQMAPLPRYRIDPNYQPFSTTSVDFAGPFLTIQGRGKVRAKRYLCLFVCAQVRAVHLELAEGLDASAFLAAFTRMSSRRGVPEKMISDNGTNFVAANRELKELWSRVDTDKLKEKTAQLGVTWEFNPPASPHFNGLHESLVKKCSVVTIVYYSLFAH